MDEISEDAESEYVGQLDARNCQVFDFVVAARPLILPELLVIVERVQRDTPVELTARADMAAVARIRVPFHWPIPRGPDASVAA